VAGVALLGIAGGAGLLIASSGGEEEVAQQVQTASPSASAAPSPPTSSPSPAPQPTSSQAPTLKYVDPTYGYSFEYPANWYLSPAKENGGQIILYSYDLASIPPEEAGTPVPKDKLKALFWIAEGIDKPLDQWLAEERTKASTEQNMPPPTVVSQGPATLGGKEGIVEETIDSEGIKHKSYYIDLGGGRVFVTNAVPSDSEIWLEFDKVLATVRFAP